MRVVTTIILAVGAAAGVCAQDRPAASQPARSENIERTRAQTDTPNTNDRLRWELITEGSSDVGTSTPSTSPNSPTNVSGTNASYLFHLDFQPLLNYGNNAPAKRSRHAHVDVGFTSVPRAVLARTDPTTSPAVETLTSQGVSVTGSTEPSPTLTRQRAFTVGGEYNDNYLIGAEGHGVFGEVGALVRLNFDTYTEDDKFFEKDGLTYLKVNSQLGAQGGYYRFETGARFRLSNGEMKFTQSDQGGNVDDLLRFELLYRYAGATAGLIPGSTSEHRLTWRFVATPRVHHPKDTEANSIKAVIGIEVDRDWQHHAPADVRFFYGTNINLEALFK
jgi:hypothetical protein